MTDKDRVPEVEVLDRQPHRLDIPMAPGEVVTLASRDLLEDAAKLSDVSTVAVATEAADRIANLDLSPDVAMATAAATAAIPDAVDEISDAEAMRLVQARKGVLNAPDAIGDPTPGVEEPHEPQTLPAVLATSVFAHDPDYRPNVGDTDIKWMTVYDLPGYMREAIRALGRSVFRTFECFEDHSRRARDAGEDPLGSVKVLASIQGQGPSRQSELDAMARWIRGQGVTIDVAHITFPVAIPGYEPRVILSATETDSFLMVEEKRENGAPCDALYIYSWSGGHHYYLGAGERLERLAALATPELPAPRRAPGRRQVAAAGRPVDSRVQAQLATATVSNVPPALPASVRRAKMSRLQEAPAYDEGLAVALRRAGFRPFGASMPPVLRKALDDDRLLEVEVAPSAASATMRVLNADGGVESEHEIERIADIEVAMETPSGPRP